MQEYYYLKFKVEYIYADVEDEIKVNFATVSNFAYQNHTQTYCSKTTPEDPIDFCGPAEGELYSWTDETHLSCSDQ